MTYLLDTNAVSEPNRPRPNAGVMAWISTQSVEETYLSVITLGEIERGILQHPDPTRRAKLQAWYSARLLPEYAGRILDVTHPVMTEWARIVHAARAAGTPPDPIDALIAATASAHGLIVVTRNIRDIAPLGVSALNIWTS